MKFSLWVRNFQYSKCDDVAIFFLVSGTRVGISRAGFVVWGSEAGLEQFLNQSRSGRTGR